MKSMVNDLIMTSKNLSLQIIDLTGELRKITKEDEESDECELFCTLEDMEQEMDGVIENIISVINFLKER